MGLVPTPIPPETRAHLTAPPAPRWCADLLADPSLQPIRASSRVKRPSTTSCALIGETLNTEDTFRAWQCFYRAASSSRRNENENENDNGTDNNANVNASGDADADADTDAILRTKKGDGRRSGTNPPPDVDELLILFSLGTGMDGHAGVLHGGILAVMFDEVLGTLAAGLQSQQQQQQQRTQPPGEVEEEEENQSNQGPNPDWTAIYTVSMTIRFRRPLTTPAFVLGRSWCDAERTRGRKVWVRGVLEDGEGGVFAEGEALYVERKKKQKRRISNL
ncbi:hypothetical protein VTN00DRAFT_8003 [Thermoascus crustaceus]|uniref:uncharacterized protein n=1 Tax=Thermoascus crustaceus TaxID=5088 RepID=UPI0037445C12